MRAIFLALVFFVASHGTLAQGSGQCESVKLVPDGALPSFVLAGWEGNVETISDMLRSGAEIDQKGLHGRTALIWAADNGHLDAVKLLVAHGANLNFQDDSGITALSSTLGDGGNIEIARLLLDAGADVNIRLRSGYTPLMIAALVGRKSWVELFLKYGVKVNETNTIGMTALSLASTISPQPEIEKILRSAGAR